MVLLLLCKALLHGHTRRQQRRLPRSLCFTASSAGYRDNTSYLASLFSSDIFSSLFIIFELNFTPNQTNSNTDREIRTPANTNLHYTKTETLSGVLAVLQVIEYCIWYLGPQYR